MAAGARQADVEQPPLLRERLVVVDRLADRQGALLEAREQHGVPLEPLRPVEREQVHAVGRALGLGRGPRLELGQERRRRRSPALPRRRAARRRSPGPAPAPPSAPGPPRPSTSPSGSKPEVRPQPRLQRVDQRSARAAAAGSRRRSRSASRTSGRSKKRWPRTRKAIPAFVRAASRGGTWALIRTRTAISAGATPSRDEAADRRHEQVELGVAVGAAPDRRRRPGRLRGHEPLAAPLRGEEPVREGEDLRAAPVVAVQGHLAGRREAGREARQERRRRAGERVDRLVLVADDAEVVAVAEPELQQALLERVRVLVLVDAEPAVARPDRLGRRGVGLEEVDRPGEHVVEVEPAGPILLALVVGPQARRTARPGSAASGRRRRVGVGRPAGGAGSSPTRSRRRGPSPW